MTLESYCKYTENAPVLEFGNGPEYFNGTRDGGIYRSRIEKQLTDSLRIVVEYKNGVPHPIDTFKLTNQSVTTWDDYWVDTKDGLIVDPKIHHINLQRNSLVYVNINTPRLELRTLNLEGNRELVHLYIHEAPLLERLNITGCTSLKYISLGINRSVRELIAKDCSMSGDTLEQLLRDFTPTVCASANTGGIGMFRKQHSTVLDLRGNIIDWSNPRIASKIRLLLTNNWVVKWDNNPPSNIVSPSLYGFYVESEIEM
jgi:hypothetical protein